MIPYNNRHWVRHLLARPGSVLSHIATRLGMIAAVSVVATLLHRTGQTPSFPLIFHTLLGTALSLLVAFRTNTAYERFWEGRKAWGMITNRCRNLVRQTLAVLPETAERNYLVALTAAFPHAVKRQLWGEQAMPELSRLLGAAVAAELQRPPGAAQWVLLRVGEALVTARREGKLDSMDVRRLENDLTALLDQLGICQRIKGTPIPLAYVQHLQRMLAMFCLTLPFALVDTVGWRTPVVVLLVSYGLLGIEQIGVEIEDPFERTEDDLDLERMATGIERDVMALAGLTAFPVLLKTSATAKVSG